MIADEHVFQAAVAMAMTASMPVAATPARDAGGDHGHAVMPVGARLAVVHAIAAPAERAVAETARQLQQRQSGGAVGDRRDRAVATRDGGQAHRFGGGECLARVQRAQTADGAHGHGGGAAF